MLLAGQSVAQAFADRLLRTSQCDAEPVENALAGDVDDIRREVIDGPPRALVPDISLPSMMYSSRRPKQQAPQDAIDDFWRKFTTKTPGKGELE